jgi:Asp/Glu/hydantoin racemase
LVVLDAESAILGCAGMAHHRAATKDACGLPLLEPSQTAATDVMSAVVAGRNSNA